LKANITNFVNSPIGIFDSGIGGLTLANAISTLLPNEQLIYFGDTAHLPYGEKSTAAIQAYTIKIIDVLLKHQCKVILIACYSASTAAYELAKEYTASKAKIISMIEPVIEYLANYANKNIGLIGTRQTINSGVFEKHLAKLDKNIQLKLLATPLLVNMIEEGFFNNNISHSVIEKYLTEPNLQNIDALVLGCTHFPLIRKEIDAFYQAQQQNVETIDASMIVAKYLYNYLQTNNLRTNTDQIPIHKFYVSDYTKSFEASTTLFFGKKVELQQYKLWE
jgi:glutamate racemase